jgi:speckle-type POZ protein
VANCSSIFAELCESNSDNRTTPIQIDDIAPDVFHLLLFYMYGGKVSDDDMKSHAKELVNAADRYGVTSLKLEAEASIVEDTNITMDNVMELLLYSDSKNCALLKETAMDFLVENKADVIEELSLSLTSLGL